MYMLKYRFVTILLVWEVAGRRIPFGTSQLGPNHIQFDKIKLSYFNTTWRLLSYWLTLRDSYNLEIGELHRGLTVFLSLSFHSKAKDSVCMRAVLQY